MKTAVVLFTRDLRVHDQPALATAAAGAERVLPLYVLDPALEGRSPNRDRFLHQCLADLRDALRQRGGDLVVRRGDPVAETMRLAREVDAEGIAVSGDVSRYARERERRLWAECDAQRRALRIFPGVTVADPGALAPAGGDHYRVFTPYYRAWLAAKWRTELSAPHGIALPSGVDTGALPAPPAGESPDATAGGEREARRRLRGWLRRLDGYADGHDLLAVDATSRLSPYLRFGCLSPLELANVVRDPASPFLRQLCWRDFYYQVASAFPKLSTVAYRPVAREAWRHDPEALARWQEGETGVPLVDAGMRQLQAEGWMHNRARLVTADFLTKHLGLDWREGLRWFDRWLLDGDVPNNAGNWQWVAGTGNDTRSYRRFNPQRQAERFDPDGAYVGRYAAG